MTFPVELEKLQGGLVFKLREEGPIFIEARPIGNPFDMTFEDRPGGTRDHYGGAESERCGNFGEQLAVEIAARGLNDKTANAYLQIGPEREITKKDTIYGGHPPIERPRIAARKIQIYSINEEVAKEQRAFIAAFVATWTS